MFLSSSPLGESADFSLSFVFIGVTAHFFAKARSIDAVDESFTKMLTFRLPGNTVPVQLTAIR